MDSNYQTYQNFPEGSENRFSQAPTGKNNGLATASLVLGIVSVAFTTVCCCCYYVAIVLSIIGIILGFVSKTVAGGAWPGKAKAGVILSFIGLILFAVYIVLEIVYADQIVAFVEEFYNNLEILGDNYGDGIY